MNERYLVWSLALAATSTSGCQPLESSTHPPLSGQTRTRSTVGIGSMFRHFVLPILRRGNDGASELELHCSATLVGYKWALTAAHCIQMQGASDALFLEENHVLVPFKTHAHPGFRAEEPDADDIALLELMRDPIDGALNMAYPIAVHGGTISIGDDLTLAGFGKAHVHARRDETLKTAKQRLVSIDERQKILTAEGDAGFSCYGDSGGPLVHAEDEGLLAIMTWSNCFNSTQGIMVRPYLPWIALQGAHLAL